VCRRTINRIICTRPGIWLGGAYQLPGNAKNVSQRPYPNPCARSSPAATAAFHAGWHVLAHFWPSSRSFNRSRHTFKGNRPLYLLWGRKYPLRAPMEEWSGECQKPAKWLTCRQFTPPASVCRLDFLMLAIIR
jgi:hypothetical protein